MHKKPTVNGKDICWNVSEAIFPLSMTPQSGIVVSVDNRQTLGVSDKGCLSTFCTPEFICIPIECMKRFHPQQMFASIRNFTCGLKLNHRNHPPPNPDYYFIFYFFGNIGEVIADFGAVPLLRLASEI